MLHILQSTNEFPPIREKFLLPKELSAPFLKKLDAQANVILDKGEEVVERFMDGGTHEQFNLACGLHCKELHDFLDQCFDGIYTLTFFQIGKE
jgi:hypothetical protein